MVGVIGDAVDVVAEIAEPIVVTGCVALTTLGASVSRGANVDVGST